MSWSKTILNRLKNYSNALGSSSSGQESMASLDLNWKKDCSCIFLSTHLLAGYEALMQWSNLMQFWTLFLNQTLFCHHGMWPPLEASHHHEHYVVLMGWQKSHLLTLQPIFRWTHPTQQMDTLTCQHIHPVAVQNQYSKFTLKKKTVRNEGHLHRNDSGVPTSKNLTLV